ncbi:MAG: hypothetical protein DI586_01145 [Micavibrio aeruginosavorus]|uniref:Acyltransferase 3 domain-containing protein n=1 Tax=Micavibrio aeruginosavorus TaxID=349221 RepID=A0A2W5FTR9_9BACT|nr:MAG: hypothetical protein DI586_01145 [Micavibrio aeruginosavorus]
MGIIQTESYGAKFLTSYDLLKSLALLLMVLDHVGYYFYPENEWFRVIGRSSMPIWLFLIGYARSRDISKPLWAGAVILIIANFIFGGNILPLNILFTILFVRLLLDRLAYMTFRNWEMALYGAFVLSALVICTYLFTEYGTIALLVAMSGYLMRNGESVNLSAAAQKLFMGYTVAFYALTQIVIFGFDKPVAQAMVVGIGAVSLLLYHFRPVELPEIDSKLPGFVVSALQFGGRYTLQIYVVHLILFKLVACLYGFRGYGWFQWDWIR